MSPWNVALIALWVVVLFNLLLTYTLIRRVASGGGNSAPPIGGLSEGATAPDFEAETPGGERLSSGKLGTGSLVLGFFSPTCSACEYHLPDFVAFSQRAADRGVRAVAVLDADLDESQALRAALPEETTTLLAPRATNPFLNKYQVYAYPSYTMVRADGTVEGTYGQVGELDDRLASVSPRG